MKVKEPSSESSTRFAGKYRRAELTNMNQSPQKVKRVAGSLSKLFVGEKRWTKPTGNMMTPSAMHRTGNSERLESHEDFHSAFIGPQHSEPGETQQILGGKCTTFRLISFDRHQQSRDADEKMYIERARIKA